ncbi:hypothetical protein HZC08_00870, partial [Candidatus Micrarchaeota archaeon]|nr:hypothetical protein [Candidatus Micrarchaeota archaeon]
RTSRAIIFPPEVKKQITDLMIATEGKCGIAPLQEILASKGIEVVNGTLQNYLILWRRELSEQGVRLPNLAHGSAKPKPS